MTEAVTARLDALIGREGRYSNNPADKGGPTCWGVTEVVARAYGYAGPMQDMPRPTAFHILLLRFWQGPRFDLLEPLFPELADTLFDIGVNSGPATGIAWLQRALNVLNLGGKAFPDIKPDGGLGPITLHAVTTFLNVRGTDGQQVLLTMVRAMRIVKFVDIAEHDPTQEEFEYGWQRARALV